MAKKAPDKSGKPWAPGDPLKLDKAIRNDLPNPLDAGKLDRADETLFSQTNTLSHSAKPMSQKGFNRQKKG